MRNVFILIDEVDLEIVGVYFTEKAASAAISDYAYSTMHTVRVETWEYEADGEKAFFYEMKEHVERGE